MQRVYLDWNATTPPLPQVLEAMREAAATAWGNPSSIHAHGRAARAIVEDARAAVGALMAMRGVDLITAVVVLAEIGDLSRFASARDLMGYLGLVPSEDSTGDSVRRGGITKAGNRRVRRVLIEAAWSYRYPARVSPAMQARVAAAPEPARKIAWKAQTRLCGRYRALTRKGKKPVVAVTAVAREMAGFVWDICRTVAPSGMRGSAVLA